MNRPLVCVAKTVGAAILLFVFVFHGMLAYDPFSSLSVDRVDSNGICGQELQDYLNAGWVQRTTTEDKQDIVVQFRDQVSGELVWRIGTVPDGTEYIKNIVTGATKLLLGGNAIHADDESEFN